MLELRIPGGLQRIGGAYAIAVLAAISLWWVLLHPLYRLRIFLEI